MLKLPVEDGHGTVARSQYKPLEGETLQQYRQLWAGTKFLIVDEISMVGSDTMQNISRRLREVTGNINETFGGMNILAVGDFYQLAPVKQKYISDGRNSSYWVKHFQMKELRVNQRQRGDTFFSNLLNKIRTGVSSVEETKLTAC